MSLISVKDLSVGYDNIVTGGLNFTVEKGDYLYILGENGTGKSTLMKTLLGLLSPISGLIESGDGLKRTEIGYLPQQTVVQKDFPASVKEIVLSGCLSKCGLRPFYSRTEKDLAYKNMERMDIIGLKDRSYKTLSGGQQQRVLLARALCASKTLLLLDEPVSGLDPKVTEEMYELIKSLNDEGLTIIMISHDVSAAEKYAQKILYIGKNSFFGSKDGFFKRRNVA